MMIKVIDMQRELLKRCIQVMDNNIEDDYEVGGATYSVLWLPSEQICFRRTTYKDTGEYYDDGSTDLKSYTSDLFEMECSLIEYTNLVVGLLNNMDEYEYEYGDDVCRIKFCPIYNPK